MEPLNNKKIYYVFTYFGYLMTDNEKMAWRHYTSVFKMGDSTAEQKAARTRLLLKKGWMTDNPEVLQLLDNGIDAFKERTVRRLLSERSGEVFLNVCPKCGQLARTPYAKQCRCGHSWRE